MRVIDGDGHVMEDWQTLLEYMPEPYRRIGRFRGRIFPPLDHLHSGTLYRVVPGAFRQVGLNRELSRRQLRRRIRSARDIGNGLIRAKSAGNSREHRTQATGTEDQGGGP